MELMYKGQLVTIKGVNSNNLAVQELSADKLLKWDASNDIWAFAIVKVLPDQASPSVLEEIQEVLDEFKDVFAEPKELPPSRVYDHPIPITPGAIPVNSKPYRYSPSHKNEIERQVIELLAAGLITPSTSPYASLVLLVQKKDDTWHFLCGL